jgi:hypothetical protein
MCPDCKSWWDLCPKHEAEFKEKVSKRGQHLPEKDVLNRQYKSYGGIDYAPWECFLPGSAKKR